MLPSTEDSTYTAGNRRLGLVGSDSKISIGGVGQDTGGLDHVAFKTAEGQGLEPKPRAGGVRAGREVERGGG